MKRKRPKDIVDKQVWRVARLAAMLIGTSIEELTDQEVAKAAKNAIKILNEAQRQVDKDVSKGAEKSGL